MLSAAKATASYDAPQRAPDPASTPAAHVDHFTPSPREVAAWVRRFRRLHQRLERAELRAELGAARAAMARIKRPARVAREALQGIRQYGAAAERDTGVSRAAQLARLWWLRLRHHTTIESFYEYELFLPRRWTVAKTFVQWKEARLVYRLASVHSTMAASETLADKRRFAEWCEREGIAAVPNLMHFEDGAVRGGDPDGADLPPETIFAKWAARFGGDGTLRLRFANGAYLDGDGRRRSPREVVADLAERSREAPLVLQRCLTNHPDFAELAPNALSTVRVMTVQRPGRRPALLVAVLRLGMGGAMVDNWSTGGIASPVDLRTGVIGTAVRTGEQLRPLRFDVHPDTGAPITGFRIPFWSQTVALALRAHERLGHNPCVGWDIAVLPSGPVLLEGNWNAGVLLLQIPCGLGLLSTEFAPAFCELLAHGVAALDDDALRAWSRWEPVAVRGPRYQGPDLREPAFGPNAGSRRSGGHRDRRG